ncbi:MAG: hypothetical protein AAF843_17035 [Bacteroidota bacterium]
MPANKKYLTTSNWSKAGKLTAAIFGGFLSVMAFHLALAEVLDTATVWGLGIVTTFICWGGFILWVYWVRVAWKAWLVTLGIVIASTAIIFISKM